MNEINRVYVYDGNLLAQGMLVATIQIAGCHTRGNPGRDTAAAMEVPYFAPTPTSVHVQFVLPVEIAASLSWPTLSWVYKRVWFAEPALNDNAAMGRCRDTLEIGSVAEANVVDVGAAWLAREEGPSTPIVPPDDAFPPELAVVSQLSSCLRSWCLIVITSNRIDGSDDVWQPGPQ